MPSPAVDTSRLPRQPAAAYSYPPSWERSWAAAGADASTRAASRGIGGSALIMCRVLLLTPQTRSEEHTSELQSLMRISYAVFCLTKNNKSTTYRLQHTTTHNKRTDTNH